MSIVKLAHNLGCIITIILGLFGAFKPLIVAKFVGVIPDGKRGVEEIRATYGGLFIGLGLYALLAQKTAVFTVVGIGWLGAAIIRLLSIIFDKSRELKNLVGVAFEAIIGLLLVIN